LAPDWEVSADNPKPAQKTTIAKANHVPKVKSVPEAININ